MTTIERHDECDIARRWPGLLAAGRMAWVINVICLATLVIWSLSDGKLTAAASDLFSLLTHDSSSFMQSPKLGGMPTRMIALGTIYCFAIASAVWNFGSLFVGAPKHRQLRSWFAFTLLAAAWLTLFVSWRELVWQGQQLRVRSQLAAFEPTAESLRTNWPTRDGDGPQLGAFMAYPQGNPHTLLMLVPSESPETTITYSAVERGDDGALRFDLTGDNAGTWLEWHPAGSTPHSFTGGLEGNYGLRRAAPLGRGWYLVRYR